MNLIQTIEPVTTLKTDTAGLIQRAQDTGQPIVITQSGKPTAVLIDVESYQQQQNALALLKILSQSDMQIRSGKSIPHSDVEQHMTDFLDRLNDVEK